MHPPQNPEDRVSITDPDKRRWWAEHAPEEVIDPSAGRLLFSQSVAVSRNGAIPQEQSLFGTQGITGTRTLALVAGDIVRLGVLGRVGRDVGSPTFRFRVYLGLVTLADSTTSVAAYSTGTSGSMFGIVDIAVLAGGAAGSVRPSGFVDLGTGTGLTTRHPLISIAPIAIDLTAPQTVNLTVQIQSGGAGIIAEATSITLGNVRA
jgi:hypothetical protein